MNVYVCAIFEDKTYVEPFFGSLKVVNVINITALLGPELPFWGFLLIIVFLGGRTNANG